MPRSANRIVAAYSQFAEQIFAQFGSRSAIRWIVFFWHNNWNAEAGDNRSGFIPEAGTPRSFGWIKKFYFKRILTRRHLFENSQSCSINGTGEGPLVRE